MTKRILNSGTSEDLNIVGSFLVFLEKTGNSEAHMAAMQVFAEEISRKTSVGTMRLMREIERDLYSQPKSNSADLAMTGLLRALNYKK